MISLEVNENIKNESCGETCYLHEKNAQKLYIMHETFSLI
jgi:hypothetical protein